METTSIPSTLLTCRTSKSLARTTITPNPNPNLLFRRNLNKFSRNRKVKVVGEVATSVDPVQAEITWEIVVGAVAGVTPFVVAGIEFSKRIMAQKRCGVCKGSGLVRREKYYFRCPSCGGFLPWQSWKRFFSGTRRNSTLLLCSTQSLSTESSRVCIEAEEESKGAKRRDALFGIVFAAVSAPSFVSLAFAETNVLQDFRVYLDETNKFKISIPQDWQVGAAEGNGIKSVTAFYPEETFNSNVSVLITGLGADFTRLESFGKVDSFAETLVGGLDRSWQKPPGVSAKLVDSKSANGMYYIEYTLQSPGESRRHIISALGISANGWYNRLYTITGQYLEEEADKYKSSVEKVVSSFRFI